MAMVMMIMMTTMGYYEMGNVSKMMRCMMKKVKWIEGIHGRVTCTVTVM